MRKLLSKRKSYTGEVIGYISVGLEYRYTDEAGEEHRLYDCCCAACNRLVTIPHRTQTIAKSHFVAEGKMPSCGCLKYSGFAKHKQETDVDLIGRRFENLLVTDRGPVIETGKDKKKRRTWKCLCDCGQITYVTTGDLLSGNTKSCGCLISVGQKKIAELLRSNKIRFLTEYSFPDLLSDKENPLRFDFAVFENNKLSFLLEYQGEQHFTKQDVWFGRQQREKTDKQKKDYCLANNIRLFEIAYNEDIEDRLNTVLKLAHDNTVPSADDSAKV